MSGPQFQASSSRRPGPAHGFGKDRRIRRRAEFQRVFDHGIRVHGRLMTLLMAANSGRVARLGIVATRKLGDAVRRNRAKRLIREVFRNFISQSDYPGVDVVVIPRRELSDATYSTLETDFRAAFRRCAARLSASNG